MTLGARTWGYKDVFFKQLATGFPRFLIFYALIAMLIDFPFKAPTIFPARLEISLNQGPLSSLCSLTTTSTGLHARN
jgi:hypothetical protein